MVFRCIVVVCGAVLEGKEDLEKRIKVLISYWTYNSHRGSRRLYIYFSAVADNVNKFVYLPGDSMETSISPLEISYRSEERKFSTQDCL